MTVASTAETMVGRLVADTVGTVALGVVVNVQYDSVADARAPPHQQPLRLSLLLPQHLLPHPPRLRDMNCPPAD